ncbi:Sec-independent protein translocase subunit TatA [Microbacterium sp. KUDC0406]|uniref:Sec-independent protein translocase subunit TatA n=1 Tax=Microbacterium sp. KUDC0406 TaxID=2909588 RepID=UPI001F2FE4C3|nr:Sec-independent protein translocase subunit TatA [Microbacterium sp. KUDC0406]UJP11067.1 Sec-independent protein translocase subunit TatA [Microbacterium sp. KUDC0406]
MAGLTGWHLLAILIVVLLLFGAAKLPALAKSVGQSARVFKGEMKAMKDDDTTTAAQTEATPESGSTGPQKDAPSGADKTS